MLAASEVIEWAGTAMAAQCSAAQRGAAAAGIASSAAAAAVAAAAVAHEARAICKALWPLTHLRSDRLNG